MHIELVDIIPLGVGSGRRRRVCALKIDGKSPVLAELLDARKHHAEDHAKIIKVIKLVASVDEVRGKHVKRGEGRYGDIYEMRGGQVRLFYFHEPDRNEIVICTNLYWKAKPSKREQSQAFKRALRFRDLYLEQVGREKR